MTKDATTFDSTTVVVADRPTATVDIAGTDYELRCPKLRVWMGVIERQEDYDTGQVLKPHIQELIGKLSSDLSDEERAKVIDQYKALEPAFSQAPTVLQLASTLVEFLCSCMTRKPDADTLRAAYHSDDGPVDIAHVRRALDDMDEAFETWLNDQSDFVGVKRPELPARPEPVNRAARRAPAKRPVTVKRASARAN